MNIKKIIKYVFVGVIGLLIGKIIIPELFDNRPFKFEKYKTEEQLEKTIRFKFPVGSALDKIKSNLEQSGAECLMYIPSDMYRSMNREIVLYCKYNTSLFSLYPFEDYRVWVDGNKNHEFTELKVRRISGFRLRPIVTVIH
jgi:hypothetical protein